MGPFRRFGAEDQKYIRLMVEHREDERQARMQRLVESLTAGRNPDFEASQKKKKKTKAAEIAVVGPPKAEDLD